MIPLMGLDLISSMGVHNRDLAVKLDITTEPMAPMSPMDSSCCH